MAITILNSATMYPKLLSWKVGNTVILVDTNEGPVLVDTGLGLHDHESPTRLVKFFRFQMGIPYAPQETIIRQLERMKISPTEIRHIIMTHLHFDHAGGLPDFPWASIHLHKKEYEAMLKPKTLLEKFAYDKADFGHKPNWVLYEHSIDKWFEFDAIALPFEPRIHLIPLFGHTSGHCGVAIRDGEGWVFQAADAIPTNAEFNITPMWLNKAVLGKHTQRIQKFSQEHPEVRILAGHTYQRLK